jgi:hypothetical protein
MSTVDPVSNELEKLLADVQRTIRENDQFIRFLKEETVDSDAAVETEEADNNQGSEEEEYEEL